MAEDYFVQSGAKDMLTTAISELLILRPRVPVAYLASHFQGLVANKLVAITSCLRAIPPNSPSFSSAVEKAFHDLVLLETSTPQQESSLVQKTRLGEPATISEAAFSKTIHQLSEDFRKPLQIKLHAKILSAADTKENGSNNSVQLTRFHRGVRVCLLLEELVDAVTVFFQSSKPMTHESAVTVDFESLFSVLQSATLHFPPDRVSALMPLLHRSSEPHTTLASQESSKAAKASPVVQQALTLHEVYDVLVDFVFVLEKQSGRE